MLCFIFFICGSAIIYYYLKYILVDLYILQQVDNKGE